MLAFGPPGPTVGANQKARLAGTERSGQMLVMALATFWQSASAALELTGSG
jgi:hypothetical protein